MDVLPKGKLRIDCGKNNPHYYVAQEGESKYKYLKKKNISLASGIAQRQYYINLKATLQEELMIINSLKSDSMFLIQEEINSVHPYRRLLISPLELSDEDYIQKWQSVEYKKKPFEEGTIEIYSEKGERVRSKSEKIIADILCKNNIPYRYECPLELKPFGYVYPDFTILDIKNREEIYLEHLEMMDNPDYSEKAMIKIDTYERNGLFLGERLLISYETLKRPLNTLVLEKKILNRFN